nr:DUF4468 domain-containing protein [uncultured Mucilaginibacter sp.]
MKTLLPILFLFACLSANAQKIELPLKDSSIVYEEIIQLDSTYKKELIYKSVKTWFVNSFKNAKEVIQSEDFSSGRIIGKGSLYIETSAVIGQYFGRNCSFTIQVDIKDAKCRYRIFDLLGSDYVLGPISNDYSKSYSQYLHNQFKGALLYSTKKLYIKMDEALMILNIKVKGLGVLLKNALVNSKSDDF